MGTVLPFLPPGIPVFSRIPRPVANDTVQYPRIVLTSRPPRASRRVHEPATTFLIASERRLDRGSMSLVLSEAGWDLALELAGTVAAIAAEETAR